MNKNFRWLKLDNAAKIFPSTSDAKNTGVFRFSCELYEIIDADVLQCALDETIKKFPHFLYIIRSGMFWYYLEESEAKPHVHEENTPPCSQLFFKDKHSLLFDVSYFENRINLEVFHALTDGTGALEFLKHLVCRYICIKHKDTLGSCDFTAEYEAPVSSRSEDSFKKYYVREKLTHNKKRGMKVYHLRGTLSDRYTLIEGIVSTERLCSEAKKYGVSLTVLLSGLLITAIHENMSLSQSKKPIALTIPVNLRKHFPSATARNFFANILTKYQFAGKETTFEEMLASLDKDFKEQLTPDNLKNTMGKFISFEKNPLVKIAPLPFKNFCLKIARRFSDAEQTSAISNIGIVKMPEYAEPYVRLVDIFASTHCLQACVCSFGDCLAIGFTSIFEEADIQRSFFRHISDMGIEVEIRSNIAE